MVNYKHNPGGVSNGGTDSANEGTNEGNSNYEDANGATKRQTGVTMVVRMRLTVLHQ